MSAIARWLVTAMWIVSWLIFAIICLYSHIMFDTSMDLWYSGVTMKLAREHAENFTRTFQSNLRESVSVTRKMTHRSFIHWMVKAGFDLSLLWTIESCLCVFERESSNKWGYATCDVSMSYHLGNVLREKIWLVNTSPLYSWNME